MGVAAVAAEAVAKVRSALTFRPLAYGYANARVMAMRSQLVQAGMLRQMLGVGSTNEVIELLERTAYKEDLVPLSLKFRGEELVELALGASFAKFAQKLRRVTPKDGEEVMAALLARYEARNLRAVLLGRKLGRNFDDVAPFLVPAGMLTLQQLREVMEAPDAQAAYAKLRTTPFGRMIFEGSAGWMTSAQMRSLMQGIGSTSTSEAVIGVLDAYYYHLARGAVVRSDPERAAIADMLELEADAKNISTLLRMKKSGAGGLEIEKMLVPGSSQEKRFWNELAGLPGVDAVVARAEKKFGLREAHEKYKADGKISHFEIALEEKAARRGLKAMFRQQMSLGVLVGALLQKEQEMGNIRKIVRGKALGLPKESIEEMLVLVE